MFETLRAHVPAARTLTDDRLTAIVAAVAVLVAVASTMGMSTGTILIGVAVAVVVARRTGGRHPEIVVHPVGAFEDAGEVPVSMNDRREQPVSHAEESAIDPLLARAMALRERTMSRT